MPRVIVTADPSPVLTDASVWLNEDIRSVHLSTDHAAAQLVQRLAWAISDAEEADDGRVSRRARVSRQREPSADGPSSHRRGVRA